LVRMMGLSSTMKVLIGCMRGPREGLAECAKPGARVVSAKGGRVA